VRIATVTAAAAVCLAGTLLAPPPALAAADDAAPVVTEITFSTDAVSVSGVDLVPVTVSVGLTDDDGVAESVQDGFQIAPAVRLESRAGGQTRTEHVVLTLASGAPQDGVWSATIQVPSTWNGHWEVGRVIAGDQAGNDLDADPRQAGLDAALDVTGTHQPAITLQFVPDPLVGDGPLTVRGRVYDTDTGEGLGRQPIYFGFDNLCIEGGTAPNGVTAADGSYSKTYQRIVGGLHCVGIGRPSNVPGSNAFIVAVPKVPRIRPVVTITANHTAVQRGAKVTISGVVRPGQHSVQLQQLGRAWRTLGSASASEGRFSFVVTPTADGLERYRVVAPNDDPELVGVSNILEVQVGPAGQGGGLPITGPATAPLAGSALILILAGIGLIRLGRRRPVATR
jgi:hypothetical protein